MSNQRNQYYMDHVIQGRLVAALVALEVLLVCASMVYLYIQFEAVIESNLYRTHVVSPDALQFDLFFSLGYVLLAMVVSNVVALILAGRLWMKFVNRVLGEFSQVLRYIRRREFQHELGQSPIRHELLSLARSWYLSERSRFFQMGRLIDRLPDDIPEHGLVELNPKLTKDLEEIRTLLIENEASK